MKYLFFILSVSIFFSLSSGKIFAQDGFSDNAATEFKARVHIPIDVEGNDDNADLGWIAPGSTKQIPAESKFVKFTISGGQSWSFTATGLVSDKCDGSNPDLFIDEITWQESSDGTSWADVASGSSLSITSSKSLSTNGKYFFRACCTKFHADQSAQTDGTDAVSLRTFNATLTATYSDM